MFQKIRRRYLTYQRISSGDTFLHHQARFGREIEEKVQKLRNQKKTWFRVCVCVCVLESEKYNIKSICL